MKELKMKTLARDNWSHVGHTWRVRLIGKPEFEYVENLIRFLDNAGFMYRITNLTERGNQWHIISGVSYTEVDFRNLYPTGVCCKGINYLIHDVTGEVLACRNETISIMVYKNTNTSKLCLIAR